MSTLDPDATHPALSGREESLQAGTLVGRFRIEGQTAQGGMGTVYRAWDPTLERYVCLKAIRCDPGQAREALERFRREAMALAKFSHPHVCQVYDWLEWQGQPYIQMEWIEGQSLDPLPLSWSLEHKLLALRDVADALAEAHAKGLIHRDLKPSNLMVDDRKCIKVLDFGLVRLQGDSDPSLPHRPIDAEFSGSALLNSVFGEDTHAEGNSEGEPTRSGQPHPSAANASGEITRQGSFLGSPNYASPEQLRGGELSPATDLFSLGILAQEWLTGEHPFPGKLQERIRRILAHHRQPVARGKLPRNLVRLLDAMLAQDPKARPSAKAVASALSDHLRPLPFWKGSLLVVLATAVLLGSLVWAYGRGVLADFGTHHPARLIVLPLDNRTSDRTLDPLAQVGFPELLASSLRGLPQLDPIDAASIATAATSLKLDLTKPLAPSARTQLLDALGAELILEGTLQKGARPGQIRLDAGLRDRRGALRTQASAEHANQDGALAQALPRTVGVKLREAIQPIGKRNQEATGWDVPPQALQAYARGKAAFLRGDFRGAEPFLREAAYAAPSFPAALATFTECLGILGDPMEAPTAQWARLAAQHMGDRTSEVVVLLHLGVQCRLRGNLDASIRWLQDAVALAREHQNRDQEANALASLGASLRESGRRAEAAEALQLAIQQKQALGDRIGEARSLNSLAMLHQTSGKPGEAEPLYRRSLELMRSLSHASGEANALNNLGTVAALRDRLDQAETHFRSALAIQERTGNRIGQSVAHNNLGVLAQIQGKFDSAAEHQEICIQKAHDAGLKVQEALGWLFLGHVRRHQKRPSEAEAAYRAALALLPPGSPQAPRAQALVAAAEMQGWTTPQGRSALQEAQNLAGSDAYVLRAQCLQALALRDETTFQASLTRALEASRSMAPELLRELESLKQRRPF